MSRVEKFGRESEIFVFYLKPFTGGGGGGGGSGGDYKKIYFCTRFTELKSFNAAIPDNGLG